MSSIFQEIGNIGRSLYSARYGEGLGAPAGINRKDRDIDVRELVIKVLHEFSK